MKPAPATLAGSALRARAGSGARPQARRRISGPTAGALALDGIATAPKPRLRAVPLRPAVRPAIPAKPAPSRPRRPSTAPPRTGRGTGAKPAPARRRAASRPATEALPGLLGHQAIERLIRGRIWIGLVCFALIGIVAMQLVILRLNTEVARSLERKGQLQRGIANLEVSNSTLSSAAHVESEAHRLGMQLPGEAQVGLLSAGPSSVGTLARLLSSAHALSSASNPATTATAGGEATSASTATATAGGAPAPASSGTEATSATAGGSQGSSEGAAATAASTQAGTTEGAAAQSPAQSSATGPSGGAEASGSPSPAPAEAQTTGGAEGKG